MNTIEINAPDLRVRESNLELLRIIAILLVLVVHADFQSLGTPTREEIATIPVSSSLRFAIQSLSDVCVNIFIFISGWFGIKPRVKRFCEFIFQIWFMKIALHFIFLILGREEQWNFSLSFVINTFFYGNWFILSYIVLYIISPMLNVFAENVSRHQFRILLVSFFAIQTLFGFIQDTKFFDYGYSPLTFVGLYLLARYVRLYPNRWTSKSKLFDAGGYIIMSGITTLCAIAYTYLTGNTDRLFYAYSSPMIIIAAFYFFLFFTKINLRSRIVNWIASSAFAAFLLHIDNIFFMPYYLGPIARWFHGESTTMFFVNTTVRIVSVFIIAILIDKIRIIVWDLLYKCFHRFYNKSEVSICSKSQL